MKTKIENSQMGAINVPQIWEDTRLSLIEKTLMWVLICRENQYCKHRVWFNVCRDDLAAALSVCKLSITRAIEKLEELKYINKKVIKRQNYYLINWDMMNAVADGQTVQEGEYETVEEEPAQTEEIALVENEPEEVVEYTLETASDNDFTVISNICKSKVEEGKLKPKEEGKALLDEYLSTREGEREKMNSYFQQYYDENEVESTVEKDWERMKCRLEGAKRRNQDWYSFRNANLYDLIDAGFSEEEVEKYFKEDLAIAV